MATEDNMTFSLMDSFIKEYVGRQPKWGPIGFIVFKRTYARSLCGKCASYNLGVDNNWKRFCSSCKSKDIHSEEYWQTCKRVVEGTFLHQKRYCLTRKIPWSDRKAQTTAQKMYDKMWNFHFTPPGRGIEFMGTKKVDVVGSAPLNNCAFTTTEQLTTDYPEPFTFMMDMSMLGIGVGFDTRGADKLLVKEPKTSDEPYIIPDSREGWVELINVVLKSFYGQSLLPTNTDYSLLRPKGSPLKTMGGVSSGPDPLIELVETITAFLYSRVGKKLSSGDIVDLMNFIGRCVVSGGRRRTAQISFGEPTDEEYISLKDPEKCAAQIAHSRWASNNSVFAHVGMNYDKLSEQTAKNGEPGYFWLDHAKKFSRMGREPDNRDYRVAGCNPCVEQSLEPYELCTLCETYMVKHDTIEEWIDTLKYAYMYAKTVTLIPTHNEKTNSVMNRNRRIGLSISGITQAFKKFGRRNVLEAMNKGYDIVQGWDKIYSEWLGIPKSIKTTSVKPSGTVSLLMGCTPGIHYHPSSEHYIRRVRIEDTSALLEPLRKSGYNIVQDESVPHTLIVELPVKEEYFDRCEKNVSIWEQLEVAAQVQQYWADNQVSVTIKFSPEEQDQIKHCLELYETRLKGVSFLPYKDHGFRQPPYEEISEKQYVSLSKGIKKLVVKKESKEEFDRFCDGIGCDIVPEE